MTPIVLALLLSFGPGTDSGREPSASSEPEVQEGRSDQEPSLFRPRICPTFRVELDDRSWPASLDWRQPPRPEEIVLVPLTEPPERFGQLTLGLDVTADLHLEPLEWPASIEYEPAKAGWPRWSLGRMIEATCP
jgi:hypothetical protein